MRPALAVLAAALLAVVAPAAASAQGTRIPMVTYNAHWGAQVAMLQELQTFRVRGRGVVNEARELARLLGWTSGGVGRHAFFRGSEPVSGWCKPTSGPRVVRWMYGRQARCLEHGNAILS